MIIGGKQFQTSGKTYVMGILNATPDSFSDGGKWNVLDRALFHVEKMLQDGMDILDIGGESTRPGFTPVSAAEEIERVLPVICTVREHFNVPISLDTCKSKVAEAGLSAGANLINDIWGLKYDPAMAGVIARNGAACCLMHNRSAADSPDILKDIVKELEKSLKLAEAAGIQKDRIILDPGIGFGKTYQDNLSILANPESVKNLGYPMLLGASRKSVIGLTLDLPAEQRIEGTIATTVMAVLQGYMFVRVHDVKENVRAIRMVEAIQKERGYG